MEAWRIPRNSSILVRADLCPRQPFGARFGLALLAVSLFAASCSDKQTTVASDTTTTTVEPVLTTIAVEESDVGVEVEDDEPQPEPGEPVELIDGVYCQGQADLAIERTEFENRFEWEIAPPELLGEQITLEATLDDLGEWRMWPGHEFAILVEPVDELLQIYVLSSDWRGIASCAIVSALAPTPATPISCSIKPDIVGATVFVSGVPRGMPIVYNIDGEFAVEMNSSRAGGNDSAERIMWRAIYTQLGESAESIAQLDDSGAQYSSVFSVPWIEAGETATASIDVVVDGENLTIDCGESGTLSNSDLELECSVILVDGLPVINVQSTQGLFANILRNGEQLSLLFGTTVDLVPDRGVPLTYSAVATRVSGEDVTADCGTVEVDVDLPLANLLLAAKPVAQAPFGPHNYWRVTPVCDGCLPEPTTLYFLSGDTPNSPWNLPAGHPGLVAPAQAHQMLLDAIGAGSEVEATVNERGNVVSYTVDGQGVSSDCLIIDTLPPELVVSTPNPTTDNYCGYVH